MNPASGCVRPFSSCSAPSCSDPALRRRFRRIDCRMPASSIMAGCPHVPHIQPRLSRGRAAGTASSPHSRRSCGSLGVLQRRARSCAARREGGRPRKDAPRRQRARPECRSTRKVESGSFSASLPPETRHPDREAVPIGGIPFATDCDESHSTNALSPISFNRTPSDRNRSRKRCGRLKTPLLASRPGGGEARLVPARQSAQAGTARAAPGSAGTSELAGRHRDVLGAVEIGSRDLQLREGVQRHLVNPPNQPQLESFSAAC